MTRRSQAGEESQRQTHQVPSKCSRGTSEWKGPEAEVSLAFTAGQLGWSRVRKGYSAQTEQSQVS